MPRRRILFRPLDPRRPRSQIDFPLFTYERAWKRLELCIDLKAALGVSRDRGLECVHLTEKRTPQERPGFWIYRVAENEYFIEQRNSTHEWAEHVPAVPSAAKSS